MNRKILSLLLLVSLCLASICTAGAETLIHNFGPSMFVGYEDFVAKHPEVTVDHASVFYFNNTDLSGAIISESLNYDLIRLDTFSFDVRPIMEKGYFVDLSGYPEIVNAVSRMYPRIQELCMVDGKIYGWPHFVYFDYIRVKPDTWAYTGSAEADMPTSFEGMLNWIAWWVDKAEAEDIRDVNVFDIDAFQYDKTNYPYSLTDKALTNHILQQQYAGGALSFNDPKLREILIRCKELGDRLAQQEVPIGEDDPFVHHVVFEGGGGGFLPKDMKVIPSRLTDDQPKLLDGNISIAAIPSTSQHKELAAALLCSIAAGEEAFPTGRNVFLFADLPAPLDPQYEAKKARIEENIADLEKAIAKAQKKGKATDTLEQDLEREQRSLNELSSYLVSPEMLEAYHAMADGLYFAPPSVFWGRSEDVGAFESLKKQYASGSITVDELLSRLDQMARMMEAEQG